MPPRNVVCIAVDGLRASALGAYGNAWHPTPAADELASGSLVCDWMFVHEPTLESFYRAAWRGAALPRSAGGASLLERVAEAGVETALVCDDAAVAILGENAGLGEVRQLEHGPPRTAEVLEETELAQTFAAAIASLEGWGGAARHGPGRLLWVHARAFHGAWDAPLELRAALLDDDDPPPPRFAAPPQFESGLDHDGLLMVRAAYAAQVTVLDQCLGALAAALAESGLDRSTLVAVVGVRGFALGEHAVAGADSGRPYGEVLHVPFLLSRPDAAPMEPRAAELLQPVDLYATLADYFALPAEATGGQSLLALASAASRTAARQFIVARGLEGDRALRTQAWMLVDRCADADPEPSTVRRRLELYVKPDDRWEANEVADRCPDVASRLLALLDGCTQGAETYQDVGPVVVDDDLVTPAR
jgi:arylsulfatase A-like enzyme